MSHLMPHDYIDVNVKLNHHIQCMSRLITKTHDYMFIDITHSFSTHTTYMSSHVICTIMLLYIVCIFLCQREGIHLELFTYRLVYIV